jgi:hypothetical protein
MINATRHCVAYGAHVPNRNFGGYDGQGALSGRFWFYRCADGPCQLLVSNRAYRAARGISARRKRSRDRKLGKIRRRHA